jgi:prophage regulatory protein
MRKLIKISDILERIPYSHAQIYNFIACGKFPSPIHLGGRAAFWIEEEVSAWLEAKIVAERVAV